MPSALFLYKLRDVVSFDPLGKIGPHISFPCVILNGHDADSVSCVLLSVFMELKSERPKTTRGWASIPLDPAHSSNQPLVDEDERVIENRQDKFLLACCRDCGRH